MGAIVVNCASSTLGDTVVLRTTSASMSSSWFCTPDAVASVGQPLARVLANFSANLVRAFACSASRFTAFGSLPGAFTKLASAFSRLLQAVAAVTSSVEPHFASFFAPRSRPALTASTIAPAPESTSACAALFDSVVCAQSTPFAIDLSSAFVHFSASLATAACSAASRLAASPVLSKPAAAFSTRLQ